MPHSHQVHAQHWAIMLGMLIGVGVLCWATVQMNAAEDAPSDDSNVDPDARASNHATFWVPRTQAAIHEKLNRKVRLNYQKATLEEIRSSLAESLGAGIDIDLDEIPADHVPAEINLTIDQPATIKLALRLMMQYAGLHECQITLERDGVRIVGPEAAKGKYVLQTLDLRGASNYSLPMRRVFIQQMQTEFTPDAWGTGDGPWMVPATSVFGVDIYHTLEVQQKISEVWNETYANNNAHGVLFLAAPFTGASKRSPEEVAKRAIELQREYAFTSLADRLKYEQNRAAAAAPTLTPQAAQRLAERDKQAEAMKNSKYAWLDLRTRSLQQLHSDEVAKFIAREGFGVARMPSPGPSFLPLPPPPQFVLPSAQIDPPHDDAPAQIPASAAESVASTAPLPTRDALTGLHLTSEVEFLSPSRFGYVKNRDKVAGFASHVFTRLPRLSDYAAWYSEPTEHWAMRRLELVSMLKHRSPRVYVSDSLPQMEELADADTRALNEFELRALKRLDEGEDVVTEATLNRIEMVGALRAAKTCLDCHDVKRGQLLGAFSYSLVREPLMRVEDTTR